MWHALRMDVCYRCVDSQQLLERVVTHKWAVLAGIIPGAGDIADATLNYMLVVRKARQAEYVSGCLLLLSHRPSDSRYTFVLPHVRIPEWLLRKMLVNNAVSAVVSLVPFVGDVVLAMYKANSRNAALLEEFLRIRGEEFLKAENQRTENPENVRPGAGTQAGEHVPGKDVKDNNGGGGWFRRRSKGKEVAHGPASSSEPIRRESRFIEDVPGDHTDSSKSRKS